MAGTVQKYLCFQALIGVCALLSSCGSEADTELEAVKSAHSAAAEWLRVEQLATARRVTNIYAVEMREKARDSLESARRQMKDPNRADARAVDSLLIGNPDAARLDRAVQALAGFEARLENG